MSDLHADLTALADKWDHGPGDKALLGRGKAMRALRALLDAHAPASEPVSSGGLSEEERKAPVTVDGRTDTCPTPGYAGRHTAVGAGAISSPYRCHGCGVWFALDEVVGDV